VQWNKSTPKTHVKSKVAASEINYEESVVEPSKELSFNLDESSTIDERLEHDFAKTEKIEILSASKESEQSLAIKIEKYKPQHVVKSLKKVRNKEFESKNKLYKKNKLGNEDAKISFIGFIVTFVLGLLCILLGINSGLILGTLLVIIGVFLLVISLILLFIASIAGILGAVLSR
jgi:uncharacterized membrane protein